MQRTTSRDFNRKPSPRWHRRLGLGIHRLLVLIGLATFGSFAPLSAQIDMPTRALLVDSTPNPNARFGSSASADGDWLAVGTPRDIDALGHRNGTVTLFQRDPGNQFIERQVLTSPAGLPPTYQSAFGQQVVLRGNRLIVAAPDEFRPLDVITGNLHCYELDTNLGWVLRETITDPPLGHPTWLGPNEFRGWRMDLHGDHLFVSFRHTNINGRVVYYHHDGTRWNYVWSLWPPTGVSGGVGFGWTISADLEAGLLMVGMPNYPITPGNPGFYDRSGRAFIYRLLGDGQLPYQAQLEADLLPPAPRQEGRFGLGCGVLAADRVVVTAGGLQSPEYTQKVYYEYVRSAAGWEIARTGGWRDVSGIEYAYVHDRVLYLGMREYTTPLRNGPALVALCIQEGHLNPVAVYWQNLSGGGFPYHKPAIGRDFVAIGADSHYHVTSYSGAVEVYDRLTEAECLRGTSAISFCDGVTTGCPSGVPAADPTAGCPNSTGQGARLHYTGTNQTLFNTGRAFVTGLPPGELAILTRGVFTYDGAPFDPLGHSALGSGMLCISRHHRTAYPVRTASANGTAEWFDIFAWSFSGPSWGTPNPSVVWRMMPFQVWYRDRDSSGAATSNTSNAILLPIRING